MKRIIKINMILLNIIKNMTYEKNEYYVLLTVKFNKFYYFKSFLNNLYFN
jgi:hypothetical protein